MPASPIGQLPPSGIGQSPRLPTVPIPPYIPPTPALQAPDPPPIIGQATDYESALKSVIIATGDVQQEVYTTQKRWRGIDVYLSLSPVPLFDAPWDAGDSIGIQVYAIVQGVRTLVATGRFCHWDGNALQRATKWMVSYRGNAEAFDVRLTTRISVALGGFTVAQRTVMVAVIATDQCVPSEEHPSRMAIGAIPFDTNFGAMQTGAARSIPADQFVPYTPVAMICSSRDTTENVFMQLFNGGAPAAGDDSTWETPVIVGGQACSGMGAQGEESGLGAAVAAPGGALGAGASTTPGVFAAVANPTETRFNLWFR